MENTKATTNPKYTSIYRLDAITMTKFWDNVNEELLKLILKIKNNP